MIRNIPQLITAGCSFQSAYFFSLSLSQADLSRFGRNYLEMGMYTEMRFPELGVRFIAVDSGVDSNNQQSTEFTPFLNVINE